MKSQSKIAAALEQPQGNHRNDMLSAVIYAILAQDYFISGDEVDDVLDTLFSETQQSSEVDGTFIRLCWRILEHAPTNDRLKRVATTVLEHPRSLCRREALRYLLGHYPDQQAVLLKRWENDPDPYVQDGLAKFLAQQAPVQALVHWKRILEQGVIPHDLAESTPSFIAHYATERDLPELDAKDQQLGGDSLWGLAAYQLRERLEKT